MPATKSPKSLSGATMGMRFMQRKTASTQQQQQQPQHSTKASTPRTEDVQLQQHKEATKDQTTETSDEFFKPQIQINQPLNVASCSTSTSQIQQPQTINNDNQGASGDTSHKINVPIIASAGDMYGISGVIIGRRSFNNFHKTVEDTWLNAVKSFSQSSSKLHGDTDEKQQQITDEELLQRYEKYVKGRGDMVDKKEKSIGNLSKKKRKRT